MAGPTHARHMNPSTHMRIRTYVIRTYTYTYVHGTRRHMRHRKNVHTHHTYIESSRRESKPTLRDYMPRAKALGNEMLGRYGIILNGRQNSVHVHVVRLHYSTRTCGETPYSTVRLATYMFKSTGCPAPDYQKYWSGGRPVCRTCSAAPEI